MLELAAARAASEELGSCWTSPGPMQMQADSLSFGALWAALGAVMGAFIAAVASGQFLRQIVASSVSGTTYRVEFEIKSYTAGGLRPRVGAVTGSLRSAVGVYSEDIVAAASGVAFGVVTGGTTTCQVDNISVKEIL